jgi:hypothetical protein
LISEYRWLYETAKWNTLFYQVSYS